MNPASPSRNRTILAAVILLCLIVGLFAAWRLGSTYFVGSKKRPKNVAIVANVDVASAPAVVPSLEDWPWWRGPNSNNIAADSPSLTFDFINGTIWKEKVPGSGHSTPCLWGEFLYLTTCDEELQQQKIVALRRDDGSKCWETIVHTGKLGKKHLKNSFASPSPACDGQRVIGYFSNAGSVHVTAVDLNGNIQWQTRVGSYMTPNNLAASPAIYRSLVIVAGESKANPFLAGLDRKTGEIVWRTILRKSKPSYSSPISVHTGGRDQLLLATSKAVVGYDPSNGNLLWTCPWDAAIAPGTLTYDNQYVCAASTALGKHQVVCLRSSGHGNLSGDDVLWRANRDSSHSPSPLLIDERLYVISKNGVMICRDVRDGKVIWKGRLGGNFFSSPLAAGGKIYAVNESGELFVVKQAAEFEILETLEFGEAVFATPIVAGGHFILRTAHHVICIGRQRNEKPK